MLVNAVVYTFPTEHAETAASLLAALATQSRAESGCLGFEVSRSIEDPRIFVLFEKWADQAALDSHYTTEHFIRYGVNGIRALAESRLAHKCIPLSR